MLAAKTLLSIRACSLQRCSRLLTVSALSSNPSFCIKSSSVSSMVSDFSAKNTSLVNFSVIKSKFSTSTPCFAFDEVEDGEEYCISYDQLKDNLEKDDFILIDVRRQDEVDAGAIPAKRYIHIPVQEVAEAFQMSESEFKSRYGVKRPSKDADNIVFHCLLGGRSTFALRIAQHLGYTRSKHYPGGWKEWSSMNS